MAAKTVVHEIYYMKPEFFPKGIFGVSVMRDNNTLPDPANLDATHTLLLTMTGPQQDPENIWSQMQGENWSPNGEANYMIELKGLGHTSMSVGDIIVVKVEGKPDRVMIADVFGFVNLTMMLTGQQHRQQT